jgi:CelD/BcsL family acetyltransferase involved in cellulose biosynthesis
MTGFRWEFQPAGTFADIGAAWDEFNAATFRLPLLSAAFTGAALRHFGAGDEQLAIAYDESGTAAIGLLRMRGAVGRRDVPALATPRGSLAAAARPSSFPSSRTRLSGSSRATSSSRRSRSSIPCS